MGAIDLEVREGESLQLRLWQRQMEMGPKLEFRAQTWGQGITDLRAAESVRIEVWGGQVQE